MFGSFSLFKTPFPGRSSLPTSFVSFFIFYIFSDLFLKTMMFFSGCLMSSASIQKLFCRIYSALKCSFDEFVGEKVVSPSYSSAILGPPLHLTGFLFFLVLSCISCLCILEINPLPVVSLAIIVSHSEGSFHFRISLAVQKLLSLIRSYLFIFINLGGE